MQLPKTGYYSKFTHVEIGRYFPDEDKIRRVKPTLIPWDDIYKFSNKHDDLGIYHSIRHYDIEKGGLDGPSLAPLHFDIDNKENPEVALRDTRELTTHLIETIKVPAAAISVYFSGMKGYHVLVNPLAIRLNLVHENSASIFRFLAEQFAERLNLTSLDYQVYDMRRMWRLAGSRHQKTGLYKTPCMDMVLGGATVQQIADSAATKPTVEELNIDEQAFSHTGAMLIADMIAQYEVDKRKREEDRLNTFLSQGHAKKGFEGKILRQFTPEYLRQHCSAVDELIKKAETEHALEHYERLFLCSLLTYTPEAIEYLHGILSKLDDYNFEISDLHIRDWIRRREYEIGGRPYTCEKSKAMGIICQDCPELEPKLYENSFGVAHIADPSPVRLAYKYHSIEEG